jgi:hypothetical protein
MIQMRNKIAVAIASVTLMVAGTAQVNAETDPSQTVDRLSANQATNPFPATLKLSSMKGEIGASVHFTVEGLKPDQDVQLNWKTVDGSYELKGMYEFVKAAYVDKQKNLLTGKSDAKGRWEGDLKIPEGFGGNHTLFITQNEETMTQSNFFVNPTFTISPASGPVGTEITITAKGIGSKEMESNWQLTYDNKLTGLISAVSTNGSAVAKIRAAGPMGTHTLTIWHGYMGMPYINHQQAPTSYLPVPTFSFEVTDDKPISPQVEPTPSSAANGGVVMPELIQAPGVNVQLNKEAETVGETVNLEATGLPANQEIKLFWNTMVGSRVSGKGFGEQQNELGYGKTDEKGNLNYSFPIPDDLGGIPHRIDLKIQDKAYGQAYLRILPSIVKITPNSGKSGSEIEVELKGVGWTEYDNTYYITYDNAYVGYVCGFNTNGDVKFNLVASGEPGYHIIDLYPGIYRGKQPQPDIYNAPQLTYGQDHPGTAIPAIRMGVEITK